MGEENKGNKVTEPEDVKTLLGNIEKGVKDSGAKIEGFEKNFNELKGRVDNMEVKSQHINTAGNIEVKDNHFPGQKMARLWKADIVAQQEKKSRTEIVERMYSKKDPDFVKEVKSLMASGNGSELIDEQYYAEIVPLLYNTLAVMTLGARKVPMPKGNLTIRKMVNGTTAAYIGEAKPANASSARFASMRLSSKKMTVKAVFSNDLLRSESAAADQMVRDDMIQQSQIAMDYTAMYGKGTEFTPLGIANTTGITNASKSEIITGDNLFTYMVTPIKKANIKMVKPGWIFNPDIFNILYNETFTNGFMYKFRDELKQGKLHGYPFVETNQVATGTDSHGLTDVFFGDFDKFFIGEQMPLEVKTSEEATYLDENGVSQSAFDNDETVVKGLMEHDMGLIYGKAFSYGRFQTK